MFVALWACVAAYWITAARAIALGIRRYPAFTLFTLVMNAGRGAWFQLDNVAYRTWWEVSANISSLFQVAVTIEAYIILARHVRNFGWRWRVLAIFGILGLIAATASSDYGTVFSRAHFFSQIAGFGLGTVAIIGFCLGRFIPFDMPRNGLIHAAVVSVMWLSSGLGYRLYYTHWCGWWILTCGPAVACLRWTVMMKEAGEQPPPGPTDEEVAEAIRQVSEAENTARELRLPFFRD